MRANAKAVQVQLSEHGRKFHLFLSSRFHFEPGWSELQRSGRMRDRESSVPTELHQHSRKLHLRLPRGLHARRRRLSRFVATQCRIFMFVILISLLFESTLLVSRHKRVRPAWNLSKTGHLHQYARQFPVYLSQRVQA